MKKSIMYTKEYNTHEAKGCLRQYEDLTIRRGAKSNRCKIVVYLKIGDVYNYEMKKIDNVD